MRRLLANPTRPEVLYDRFDARWCGWLDGMVDDRDGPFSARLSGLLGGLKAAPFITLFAVLYLVCGTATLRTTDLLPVGLSDTARAAIFSVAFFLTLIVSVTSLAVRRASRQARP